MKILVNLIGGQPAPNFLAAKEIQPDKILNIYSQASEEIMKRLNDLLRINTITPPLKVNAYDFNEIYSQLSLFLKDNNHNIDEIILNITGGTKIMSIAAFEAAKNFNLKSIYLDSENHILYEFVNEIIEVKNLQKKISIKDYFSLHGFSNAKENTIKYSPEIISEINKFDAYLSAYPESVSKVLELTDVIVSYKRKNRKKWLKEDVKLSKGQNYFEWKYGNGIIHYLKKDEQFDFKFRDENFIDYHNGRWFEKTVYLKLKESGKYDEVLMNYEIYSNQNVLLNELDIVAIKNEKLDIFECKSGGLFQDDLNKLKAVKDTLGKYSNISLITFYEIHANNENGKVVRQKLNDYKIKNYVFFRQSLNIENPNTNPNL